mgnify:FL=1
MSTTNFHIINASAGSGKTHTLVLEYLKILLSQETSQPFRSMLALTFTNKAVHEMKARILETLVSLSQPPSKEVHMATSLCNTLSISDEELAFRSGQMLRKLLLEYGSFDVITLDTFTHRLVRTFARDFQLPYGFEVVLDPTDLFEETIDSIIAQVGKEEVISDLLLLFSLNKVKSEKDWDVQKDLSEFISMLLSENDREPIADIKNKTLEELQEDKKLLKNTLENTKKEALQYATKALTFLTQKGLEAEDFKLKLMHKHFENVLAEAFTKLYENQLEAALNGEKPLYNKTLIPSKKALIDEIQPELRSYFYKIKKAVGQYLLIQRTLKSWTPRTLLQLMEQRLNQIQNDKEVRLLGEFNKKISQLVQEESAPFIFERLGARYQHYFLDEFQDTSSLQWSNLIPLIGDALENERQMGSSGSLLLVGDPKQAIYRWRGGNMEQYIELINQTQNPFQIEANCFPLEHNFRSGKEIVDFNNAFFQMHAKHFEKLEYQKIYGEGSQQHPQKEGGYVCIEAIPRGGTKEETTPLYVAKTLTALETILKKGYGQNDIAILVRKKTQAAAIGTALIQEGYDLVSSESLQVSQSKKVQLLIAILQLTLRPHAPEFHKIILDVLWELEDQPIEEYHEFAKEILHKKSAVFLSHLRERFQFELNLKRISSLPVSEALEYVLFSLPSLDIKDAYVHSLLEDVFEFSKTHSTTTAQYLNYWKHQGEQLRIVLPEALDAIQLMTIHQAKGLEFPVVILPFMDTPLSPGVTEKVWHPFKEGPLESIQWGWINFSKELLQCGIQAEKLYDSHRLGQHLDAFNVLYVALTRAVAVLYVITQEVDSGKSTYAHLFHSHVEMQGKKLEAKTPFEQGVFHSKKRESQFHFNQNQEQFALELPLGHAWKKRIVETVRNTKVSEAAKSRGVLLHKLLAKVTTANHIPRVVKEAMEQKLFSKAIKSEVEEKLKQVTQHPNLAPLFDGQDRILCEQDLLVPNGPTLRPDRINFSSLGVATVLDYKTGIPKKADEDQLLNYTQIIKELGYKQVNSYLVYLYPEIQIHEVNPL